MITEETLNRLEQLCQYATPGPWKNDSGNGQIESEDRAHWRAPIVDRLHNFEDRDHYKDFNLKTKYIDPECNMDLIAESRSALPELIAEVRRLRAGLEGIKKSGCDLVAPCRACMAKEFLEGK